MRIAPNNKSIENRLISNGIKAKWLQRSLKKYAYRKSSINPPRGCGGEGLISNKITNDVGKLTANEIRTNMENCLVNLKHRCPNGTIAISGLTYVPRDNSKNQLIDEINCHYESICTDLSVTFIDNKRVTCDNYGASIRNVCVEMCRWDPGSLNLYQS